MPFVPINLSASPAGGAVFSQGTRASHWIYTSGVVAIEADDKSLGIDDIKVQTRFVLEQIKKIVTVGGGCLADIVMNQIFLKDFEDYSGMNEIYTEFFSVAPPARYCVRADLVRPEWLVEIAAIAYVAL